MILMIYGAQKSPPKTYFFVMFFNKLRTGPNSKPSSFICFTRSSPPRFTKTTLRKAIKQFKKSKRPFTSLKIAQAPKPMYLQRICLLKVMIGRLPGTPPGRPKRSQNLPRELPRTLRALRGPSRTPRTPWESRNLLKIK